MRGKVIHSLCDRPQRGITPAYAGKRRACWWTHRRTRDHPRVCGEKSKTKDTAAYTPGSPPHVRGKVSTRFCAISCHGITPACAGKRCLHRFCKGISKDHPRVCGEKSRCWLDLEPPTGSPPRMRGKGLGASKGCDGVGITPACAGKSASHGCCSRGWRDHPRVCGEKVSAIHRESASLGSPPRMRGKVTSGMLFLAFIGITPAYAGKRQMARKAGRTKPDHPRVCGEKPLPDPERIFQVGSPPRMRGKVPPHCCFCPAHGITPAYAGKSLWLFCCVSLPSDHPRVCGEKPALILRITWLQGSPPRMRGKVCVKLHRQLVRGITPAYAGEKSQSTSASRRALGSPPRMRGKVCMATGLRVSDGITPAYAGKRPGHIPHREREQDHPRVCGEKIQHPKYTTDKGGSPPRMRGKERYHFAICEVYGITPAYAGKSAVLKQLQHSHMDHPRVCGEKRKRQ